MADDRIESNLNSQEKPDTSNESFSEELRDLDDCSWLIDAATSDQPPESLFSPQEDDWSLQRLANHPGGLELALKENIERMERRTLEIIDSGTAEEIAQALEENTNQLRLLQERISKILYTG